jgi:hypothetical protein
MSTKEICLLANRISRCLVSSSRAPLIFIMFFYGRVMFSHERHNGSLQFAKLRVHGKDSQGLDVKGYISTPAVGQSESRQLGGHRSGGLLYR